MQPCPCPSLKPSDLAQLSGEGRSTDFVRYKVRLIAMGCKGDGQHGHVGIHDPVLRNQYWLTRVVFLRCLGFVYMVAFLVALNDNGALVRNRLGGGGL